MSASGKIGNENKQLFRQGPPSSRLQSSEKEVLVYSIRLINGSGQKEGSLTVMSVIKTAYNNNYGGLLAIKKNRFLYLLFTFYSVTIILTLPGNN